MKLSEFSKLSKDYIAEMPVKLGLVFGNFFWRFELKVKIFLRLSHLYKVPTFLLEKK